MPDGAPDHRRKTSDLRASDTLEILRCIPADFAGIGTAAPSVASAVEQALDGPEEIVCIVGSFFTVGEAMEMLGIEPYEVRALER